MAEASGKVGCTSNGYGFVRFKTEDDANKAISAFDTKDEMVVERFDREAKSKQAFNNLYVKEFPATWKDADLKARFEKYGPLGSVKVQSAGSGTGSGFGFVCFEKPEDAQTAINKEHNLELEGRKLYVARAEKKENR